MHKGLWERGKLVDQRIVSLEREGVIASHTADKVMLSDYWEGVQADLQRFFPLAIHLTNLVGLTHQHLLIPQPFYPGSILVDLIRGNIVYHPDQTFVPFEETTFFLRLEEREASWYLAPEQMGQVQFRTDYRCTIYSLGVLFYELLAGFHPFKGKDETADMPADLTRRHLSLHDVMPSIPLTLSVLIDKMLAKNPDERYLSAFGIKEDLTRACLEWQRQGYISYFQLGEKDQAITLQWNKNLMGREQEMKLLNEAFLQVGEHVPVLVSVTGQAGVGKSALVDRFCRQLSYPNIITVRCEQPKVYHPYDVIIKILKAFLLKKIARCETELKKIREYLKNMPGFNHALLAQIVPEIHLILGPAPTYHPLPPAESEASFRFSVQSLFQILLADDLPWVLVVDDLQWIDQHSLYIFDQLFQDGMPTIPVMVIGLYREEIHDHVLSRFKAWSDWFQTKGTVIHIQLNPLELDHLTQWCVSLFHCTPQEAIQVAKPLHYKTLGNPFFIKKVLQELYDQRCFYFDYRHGRWIWDLNGLQSHKVSDNIASLIEERVGRLSEEEQHVLKAAACIGIEGDVDVLARVVSDHLNLERILEHCQQLGMVNLTDQKQNEEVATTFSFAHDQIWQAIFQTLTEAEKEAYFEKIGRILLADFYEGKAVNIPEMVRYLNHAQKTITDRAERLTLARLNLQAAQQMKSVIAYTSAIDYLEQASKWMADIEGNELYMMIQMELAQCFYLTSRQSEAEAITEQLLQSASVLVQKMGIYQLKINMYRHLQKYEDAIQLGMGALQELGIFLPEQVSTRQLVLILARVRRMMSKHFFFKVAQPPNRVPKKDEIVIRLYEELSDLLYMRDPNRYVYLTLQLLIKRAKGELLADSPVLYSNFAMICIKGLDNIQLAERSIRLAMRLAENHPFKGHIYLVDAAYIHIWSYSYVTSLPKLDEAFEASIKNGQYHVGLGPVVLKLLTQLFLGVPIAQLLDEVDYYLTIYQRLNLPMPMG